MMTDFLCSNRLLQKSKSPNIYHIRNEVREFDQLCCNNSLEIIIESVHFMKADNHDGFYELFTLCVEGLPVTGDVDDVSLLGFLHVRQELTCKKRLAIFYSVHPRKISRKIVWM
jgi:hypothetical protein